MRESLKVLWLPLILTGFCIIFAVSVKTVQWYKSVHNKKARVKDTKAVLEMMNQMDKDRIVKAKTRQIIRQTKAMQKADPRRSQTM